jgi:hypothetical protein
MAGLRNGIALADAIDVICVELAQSEGTIARVNSRMIPSDDDSGKSIKQFWCLPCHFSVFVSSASF